MVRWIHCLPPELLLKKLRLRHPRQHLRRLASHTIVSRDYEPKTTGKVSTQFGAVNLGKPIVIECCTDEFWVAANSTATLLPSG
jgi:hypothetical protein